MNQAEEGDASKRNQLIEMHNRSSNDNNNNQRVIDYDKAIEMAGGYGKAQIYISFFLILSFLTKSWVMYGLPYLEKTPDYQCIKDANIGWVPCLAPEICIMKDRLAKYNTEWRINYDSKESFHNWVDPNKLDLVCVQENIIALPAMMYFVGFAISSGVTGTLSDKLGRKWPFLISMII